VGKNWGKENKWKSFLSIFTRWFYPSWFADPNYWQGVQKKQRGKRERSGM